MSKFRAYIGETVDELLHKVTWPTWKELQSSSLIVLVASVLIAISVWLMDTIFGIASFGSEGIFSFWKGLLGFVYAFFS